MRRDPDLTSHLTKGSGPAAAPGVLMKAEMGDLLVNGGRP
jgi:hypothetical protein